MQILRIHHYTSIEALALILASKKIRFNRVDRVDDITESLRHSKIRFGNYFFVSCWTYDSEESIPQWHMYTDRMRGVRISLPVVPFQRKKLIPPSSWKIESEGVMYAPLSLEEQFGPDYYVVPTFMKSEHFGGPVEYCDDVETRYEKAIRLKTNSSNRATIEIDAPFDLVRLKTIEWSFQKEYRFALFVLPSLELPVEGPGSPKFCERLPDYVITALVNGIAPGIEFLDVDLSDNTLKELEVTFGPLCSEGSKIVVRALINSYAPEATIRESQFSGNIRTR